MRFIDSTLLLLAAQFGLLAFDAHAEYSHPRSRSLSLHAYGRAIDIFAVRIAGGEEREALDYFRDHAFAETGWLTRFWNPLVDCLSESFEVVALDHRYNADHENHIHVSAPYPDFPDGVARGD